MKKNCRSKKGSTLVFTLIAMSFISLLALAVITMTITNIRLKGSAKKSQKTTYYTDAVVDNIKAGIQDMSSKASAEAYKEALSSYTNVLSGGTKSLKEIYDETFLSRMVSLLSGNLATFNVGTSDYLYSDDVIKQYIKSGDDIFYQQHNLTGDNKLVYDNGSLTLKNIEVIYTKDSYTTDIKTDIRIDIPYVDTETHSEYLDYALIADNKIVADQSGTNNILGSIYAGTSGRTDHDKNSETGLFVAGGAALNIKAANIITRGDISLCGKSTLDIEGDGSEKANVWAENINVTGGMTQPIGGNTLTVDGDCNVADDLSLNGKDDKVTLKGGYYGYNYNKSYDNLNVGTCLNDAEYSSAILVNGKNCSINMDGLKKLILAGRTFISKNSTGEKYAATNKDVANKDILMGESLAVKGSQLAYYVSDDYWKKVDSKLIVDNPDEKTFEYSTNGSNDIYTFKYGKYLEDMELNGKINLFDYVDDTTPLVYYYRNDTSISAAPVTYFYLNFKSQKKASQFYEKVMTESKKKGTINSVMDNFMNSTGITINNNAIMMHSGNIVYKNGTLPENITLKISNEDVKPDSGLAVYAKSRSKEYMSRQLSLIADYSDAMNSPLWRLDSNSNNAMSKKGTKDATNLFAKLIKTDALTSPGTTVKKVGKGVVVISADSTFKWDSGNTEINNTGCDGGIIIAEGDVELYKDFHGLIIAGGNIKFAATGITVKADSELTANMFSEDKSSAVPIFYNKFSQYFKKIVDSTISVNKKKSEDTVQYENWARK